ncbi:amidase family protein [Streptomyces sp. NPDC127068]|uniref:amidase family protein n=1 Tax=Streptomyces sp. NPDC127068 TaxID=3347127 RepID=UPI0036685539
MADSPSAHRVVLSSLGADRLTVRRRPRPRAARPTARSRQEVLHAPAAHTGRDGVLSGALLAVKDNIDVAGAPTTAGTPALLGHVPRRSSHVWERCARTGGVLAGKTALHELAYGTTGQHALGPAALDPHSPDHLAGGSSSGTASAVAAHLVPAGLGTDTGGSVRIPAALCGIIGYRPTTGRYPTAGVVRVSLTRYTVGVMARSVPGVRLLDGVLAGAPPRPFGARVPHPLRAVLPAPLWADLDPQVERVCRVACERLRAAGWYLVEESWSDVVWSDVLRSATLVPAYETCSALGGYLAEHPGAPSASEVLRGCEVPLPETALTPRHSPDTRTKDQPIS